MYLLFVYSLFFIVVSLDQIRKELITNTMIHLTYAMTVLSCLDGTGKCHAHMHTIGTIITQNACYGVRFIVLVTFVVHTDRHLVYQIERDSIPCDSSRMRFRLNSQSVEWNRQNVGEDVYIWCEYRRTDVHMYACVYGVCERPLYTTGETKAIGPCFLGICYISVYLFICLSTYIYRQLQHQPCFIHNYTFLFR